MGDLLRGLRILGPVFRLMGRYRAATVVGLVLAVGWFVVGLSGRSDAADGLGLPGPSAGDPVVSRSAFDQFAGDLGHGALWLLATGVIYGALCWLIVGTAYVVVVGYRRLLRVDRDPVCGEPGGPDRGVDVGGGRPPGAPGRRPPGLGVGL